MRETLPAGLNFFAKTTYSHRVTSTLRKRRIQREAENTDKSRSFDATTPDKDVCPPDDRISWLATGFIFILAAITRFWNISHPTDKGTPIFDEKHYAPQSYNVSVMGVEENPAYGLVVHPPVAKQIEAIGQFFFGYSPLGWRFMAAVLGIATIVITMRMARRITRSTQLGVLAGVLLTVDGVFFITSRIGMLDIFQVFFIVAAAAALLVDRDQANARMHQAYLEGRTKALDFGPRLGFRWWRLIAGVSLGLATGVKWSGLYYIAFFGFMSVMFDLARRRRYGVRRPVVGTLVMDTPPALFAIVGVGLAAYFFSWMGWIRSENAVYRHMIGTKIGPDGPFAWVPESLRSMWYYNSSVLEFHNSLSTSNGNRHPWESKPWAWPMSLRPMLYYYEGGDEVTGCGEEKCVEAILLVGTHAIWWLAIPVLAWAAWRAVANRDSRYVYPLVGYAAGFVPWLITFDRQMYFFYASALVPFFVILLVLALGEIAGKSSDTAERRKLGLVVVALYMGVVVANFVWIYPILSGSPISEAQWQNFQVLPSYR